MQVTSNFHSRRFPPSIKRRIVRIIADKRLTVFLLCCVFAILYLELGSSSSSPSSISGTSTAGANTAMGISSGALPSSGTTSTRFQSSIPTKSTAMSSSSDAAIQERLRGALWGFFVGDALSAPTHWYYGGKPQIVADYGGPILDYTKPKFNLTGSILNKSNLNGGGRATPSRNPHTGLVTSIVGDVINHGKKELWDPNKSIHYHATLLKGENTLEAQIARVLMKTMVNKHGNFDIQAFREAYKDFMTTPDSHNDTYVSTCHRMFFANLVYRKLPLDKCPDNDHHNVDTIDGLVLPTIVAMVDPSAASACADATRDSQALRDMSGVWGQVVQKAILEPDDQVFLQYLTTFSLQTLGRPPNPSVQDGSTMSACYLNQALPGLIDMAAKYLVFTPKEDSTWAGLLANANVGGENVHRGSILGAILGARCGVPKDKRMGLYDFSGLAKEIDLFVAAATHAHRK
eukprot:Nitzschia sp. Nitz4//scaffold245_size28976//16934//18392//NITZ4_008073-RA/size28976-augustus-gene-0.1-mRNA-1//1//CDS//3329543884//323//frame0